MKVTFYKPEIDGKTPKKEDYLILRNRRFQENGSNNWYEFDYCPENRFEGINYRINDLFSIQKETCTDGSRNYLYGYFVKLSLFQSCQLKWMFGKHLLQKNNFWMWLVGICIAIFAIIMSYLNLH